MSVGLFKLLYMASASILIPHLPTQDDGLDEHARARLLAIESFKKIPGIG